MQTAEKRSKTEQDTVVTYFLYIFTYTYIRKMLLFLCENLIWFLQEFDLTLFRANQIFSTNFVQFFRTNLRKQKIQQRKI